MLRYETGTGCAIARGDAVVLLRPNTDHDLVMRLWEQLGEDSGLVEVLQVLTGAFGPNLRTVPPFASVVVKDRKVHVAVRGEMSVSLDIENNGEIERLHVDGMDVTTWSERVLDNVVDLMVGLGVGTPGAAMLDDDALPLGDGVVRADALARQLAPRPVKAVPEPVRAAEPAPAPAEDAGSSRRRNPGAGRTRVDSEESRRTSPGQAARAAAISEETIAPVEEPRAAAPRKTAAPVSAATSAPAPVAAAKATVTDGAEGDDDYSHLWGSTVLRNVEDAAVRPADGEDEAPQAKAVPRAVAKEAPAAKAAARKESLDDHDGHTVTSAEMARLRAAAASPAAAAPAAKPAAAKAATAKPAATKPAATKSAEPIAAEPGRPGTGQHILARTCRNGHANPPSREACAVCGIALEGDADLARRPALGRIVVSTGEVVELDRGVVVGRRPRVVRGAGGETPRLVTVPSPQQDISRSHVEVRLEGWHVLVNDMNTTNGTTLLRVGQPPRRLHPSEPILVVDGDVADLGDGVTLTFEGLR